VIPAEWYAETHPGAVAAIVLDRTPAMSEPLTWVRHEFVSTPSWSAKFGPARWPRAMSTYKYPFLAAITNREVQEAQLADIRGGISLVRVDAYQTPYRTFVLLWLPPPRRFLPRRRVVVVPSATAT